MGAEGRAAIVLGGFRRADAIGSILECLFIGAAVEHISETAVEPAFTSHIVMTAVNGFI